MTAWDGNRALWPVVRLLGRDGAAWKGCGFVVPAKAADAALTVMTCAHVVADALEDSEVQYRPMAPPGDVRMIFATGNAATQVPVVGQVITDAWRPVPLPGQPERGAIDIAVLRFPGLARPNGTDFPLFRPAAAHGTRVAAYGPEDTNNRARAANARWATGEVLLAGQDDTVEFVPDANRHGNTVEGGFSGGPLIDEQTFEILGMVRKASANGRKAYALPLPLLADVWEPLVRRARPRRREKSPLFDMIDRVPQVMTLGRAVSRALRDRRNGGHAPSLILAVEGPDDEDHLRFRARAKLEIEQMADRGKAGPFELAEMEIKLLPGMDLEDRLGLMAFNLRQGTGADAEDADALRRAFASGASGWIVQLRLEGAVGDADAALLERFLQFWAEIATGATCEFYLVLSFVFSAQTEPDCSVARAMARVLAEPGRNVLRLPPLAPVTVSDFATWKNEITRQGHADDPATAARLASAAIRLFPGDAPQSMRPLVNSLECDGIGLAPQD